ncbi:MAG TPA: sigma-70 family RNA polymerase sigma factor [Polyangiaceae bacterium]
MMHLDHSWGIEPATVDAAAEKEPMSADTVSQVRAAEPPQRPNSGSRAAGLEQLVKDNLDFVWRLARHLGLPEADADDVAQRVMIVASNRFDDIEPGKERAFLYRTTLFIGQKVRRSWGKGREVLTEELPDEAAPHPQPDELLDKRRAYADLHRVLQRMPENLRTALVLYELEGWTLAEIAAAQGIPQFTVASRVRRARKHFLRTSMSLKQQLKGNLP